MYDFSTFPKIETENLILRGMDNKDIQDIFEMRNNPIMIEFTDGKIDESIIDTQNYIDKISKGIDENKWIIWVMEHKATNKVIGTISIWNIDLEKNNGELGYGIVPGYQGKGYMKEALLKVVEFAFNEMKLDEVLAYTEKSNLRSCKLLERCNFIVVDLVREEGFYKDQIFDMVVHKLGK